jgi:hypothetical protein
MTRHRFDVFSFLAGAATVTVALLILLDAVTISAVDLRIIGPVVVLALGAALLVGGGRDRRGTPAEAGAAAVEVDSAPVERVDTAVIEREDTAVVEDEDTAVIDRDDHDR